MSARENTGNDRIGARKDALRRRSRSLLAGVSLLALAATPALAEDWQQRLRDIETGAAPAFDLGNIQLAQAATAEARRFDIPAGDLQSALLAFSQTVDLQLLYPAEMTAGLTTRGVQGEYTPEEALRRLLAGTGLNYRFSDADTVTLAKAGAQDGDGPIELGTITVAGTGSSYKADTAVSATKTDTDIMNVPHSVQVVPEAVLKDQAARKLADALENVSSIDKTDSFGQTVDDVIIRGFFTRDVHVDGVRTTNTNVQSDLANVERIEVVKGPASVLYGRIEPGGLVNVVTKKPQREASYEAQATGGEYDFYRGEFDLIPADL